MIDRVEEVASALEAIFVDTIGHVEIANLEVLAVGIGSNGKWPEGRGEVARVGKLVGNVRNTNVRRKAVAGSEFVGNHGAHGWENNGRGRAIASEHVVGASLVSRFSVSHGADDGHLVGDLGGVGHLLAELDAFDRGVDGIVGATVFGRRVRLRIPGLVLCHATGEENLNDRLCHSFTGFVVLLGGLGFHLEKLGEGQPKASKEADMEKSTTGEIVGERVSGAGLVHEQYWSSG